MNSKVQINSSKDNKLWTDILKNHWKINSNISNTIQHLEDILSYEENYLLRLQPENEEYKNQLKKISQLKEGIKKYKKSQNRNLETIRNVSTILTKTTC